MEGELLLDVGAFLFAGAAVVSLAAVWFDDRGDSAWLTWTLMFASAALSVAGHIASGGLA